MLSWPRDQRGSVLIEFALVLPIFVLILYASVAIWKVITVKDSLAAATYQAARYLSVRGYWDRTLRPGDSCQGFPWKWQEEAARIVGEELSNNPFAALVFPDTVVVSVSGPPSGLSCPICPQGSASPDLDTNKNYVRHSLFSVETHLEMAAPAIPFLLTGQSRLTLNERQVSYMECRPLFPGEPTPTPTVAVTPAGSWGEGRMAPATPTPQAASGDVSSNGG